MRKRERETTHIFRRQNNQDLVAAEMREKGRKEVNMIPKFLAGAVGAMLTEVGITGEGERWVLGREW